MGCLLFAKFVPGLYTVTPPVAGMVGLSMRRFVMYDIGGITIWAGTYAGLGWLMRDQLEWLLQKVTEWGASLLQVVLFVVLAHLVYKFVTRQLFIRQLRTARIAAEELKGLIDNGEELMIADLRHSSTIELHPFIIPGAQVVSLDFLDSKHHTLPRDRDIILYCT